MSTYTLNGMRIFNKADTYENWKTNNPILGNGEIGFESDTYRMKVGDGVSLWRTLPYTNCNEIDELRITYENESPSVIAKLPELFFINTVTVEIEEAWDSVINLSIGTNTDPNAIFSSDEIDLLETGTVFVYRINQLITEPTELKVFMGGGVRTKGSILVSIK